jgi:uncharacterized protein
VLRFSIDCLTTEPWRNGGGVTRTVATGGGAHAREWDWRISIADITQSGPFSTFPKMDRQLTLIEGHGIVLRGVSGSMRLAQIGDSVAFPGEEALHVTLIDGPVRACNVIARRGVSAGVAQVHHSAVLKGPYNVALVLAGEFSLGTARQPEEILRAGDGIHVANIADAPMLQRLGENGAVLCAAIREAVTQP